MVRKVMAWLYTAWQVMSWQASPMLTPRARRALLADMSDAWRELNTTLQLIGHGATQGVYGKGRRRKRSAPLQYALDDLELSDHE